SYVELSNTYGSDLRDMAMILETMVDKKDFVNAALVLKNMSDLMNSRRWWGTHTTAYCILAVSKFALNQSPDENISFDYQFGNGDKRSANTAMNLARITLKDKDLVNGNVTLTNKGSSLYYVQVVTTGRPFETDSLTIANSLKLKVNYTDMAGNTIDINSLEMGTSFQAIVSVTNPGLRGYYEEMALTQMFPSGWEITNTRFEGTSGAFENSSYEYQDIRDDRVLTYFDIPRSRTYEYRILLNASYAGKYYLPAITCNAMYDNSISASLPGKWITVNSKIYD
ncbi:MAG: hypothetical protein ACPGLV_17010, partial [Bacteroidia bacterium]